MSDPSDLSESASVPVLERRGVQAQPDAIGAASSATLEPILCRHCGRTASNGISCEGACVADSGY